MILDWLLKPAVLIALAALVSMMSQRAAIRQFGIGLHAKQIVQQQRMLDHAFGKQRAAGEDFDQAPARGKALFEQGQISRAPQHRVQQAYQSLQAGIGHGAGSRCLQQMGHKPIQAPAPASGKRAHARTGGQCLQ